MYRLARYVYERTLRPRLPRKISVRNEVAVRDHYLLDITKKECVPSHEEALVEGIISLVKGGDDVVVVGGGRGVSTVRAARCVGKDGSVTTFEAAKDQVDLVRETVHLNNVEDRTEVHHALVGPDLNSWGDIEGAEKIAPDALPDSDVLVLDCEGAELEILQESKTLPPRLVVETHGFLGASREDVESVLQNRGYEITYIGAENEEQDVHILTGTR